MVPGAGEVGVVPGAEVVGAGPGAVEVAVVLGVVGAVDVEVVVLVVQEKTSARINIKQRITQIALALNFITLLFKFSQDFGLTFKTNSPQSGLLAGVLRYTSIA